MTTEAIRARLAGADIPIIFSGPMVRALLDGRKTMTRRLAVQTRKTHPSNTSYDTYQLPSPWQKVKPGDRLWVRESGKLLRHAHDHDPATARDLWEDAGFIYSADDAVTQCQAYDPPLSEWIGDCAKHTRPSIHMPRWASRLTLLVEAVKVERLQDITGDDALAEGIHRRMLDSYNVYVYSVEPRQHECPTATAAFKDLWMRLHGHEAWNANPEVVAISFKVVKQNIDALASDGGKP